MICTCGGDEIVPEMEYLGNGEYFCNLCGNILKGELDFEKEESYEQNY